MKLHLRRAAIVPVAATVALACFASLGGSVASAAEAPREKLVAQAGGVGGGGVGGGGAVKDDEATKTKEEVSETKKNPFGGSIFLFDQSATTNSFSKGSQLSYSPSYEWWLSPRVYYTWKDHWKLGARFDFFKEWTNHEETTEAREWRPGDPWLSAAYGAPATFLNDNEASRWSLGLLVRPPLSKESRGNGQYLALGPTGSISYGLDLNKGKKFFKSVSFNLYASYTHSFTKYTTPAPFNGFDRPGTNTEGGAVLDSQVRSGTLAGNSLLYSLGATLDVLENVSWGASMIFIDQFSYRPPDAAFNGDAVPRSGADTRLRQLTWFLTSVDWDPLDELGVSVGYYNLATALRPDGTRRNPLWSPDARVFLSLTAHLDSIVDDVTKRKEPGKPNTALAQFGALR